MFFKNIADVEVAQFHETVRINTNGYELNNAYVISDDKIKIIPLFYFDEIEGESELLAIIDDSVVLNMLDHENMNVVLSCLSFNAVSSKGTGFDVLFDVYSVSEKHYLILHLYHSNSGFAVNNFTFNFKHKISGTIIANGEYSTNNRGNIVIPITSNSGEVKINEVVITLGN